MSLDGAFVPTQWKTAVIRPKAKVTAPKTPADYRHISVLPILSRVVERFIHVVQRFIYPSFDDLAPSTVLVGLRGPKWLTSVQTNDRGEGSHPNNSLKKRARSRSYTVKGAARKNSGGAALEFGVPLIFDVMMMMMIMMMMVVVVVCPKAGSLDLRHLGMR